MPRCGCCGSVSASWALLSLPGANLRANPPVQFLGATSVWAWRRPGWRGEDDQTEARKRFLIPRADGPGAPIRLGVPGQRVARHVAQDTDPPAMDVRGLLLPMLGSGASLSAGVAIGHYKTPLSVMLSRASDLETMAKAQGRSAIALGHASRGGVKTGFSLPWGVAEADEPPTAAATLTQVIKAFRKGTLPGRLPYKLRDISASVNDALDVIGRSGQSGKDRQAAAQTLLRGMFRSCLEGSVPDSVKKAAEELWLRGVTVARACPDADGSVHPEHFADGLLVCRELARDESAGEAEA